MKSGKSLAEIESIVLDAVTSSLRLKPGVAKLDSGFEKDLNCGSVDFVDVLTRLERKLGVTLMKQPVFDQIVPDYSKGFDVKGLVKIVFSEVQASS